MPDSTPEEEVPFRDWLDEVANDPLVVSPDDAGHEFLHNRWTFRVTSEQARGLAVDDLEMFFASVIEARRRHLLDHHGGHRMVFCVWEIEAELGFSVLSASFGGISIREPYRTLPSVRPLLEAFLSSRHHDGIPWEDLERIDLEDSAHASRLPEPAHDVIDVYIEPLP